MLEDCSTYENNNKKIRDETSRDDGGAQRTESVEKKIKNKLMMRRTEEQRVLCYIATIILSCTHLQPFSASSVQ